MKKSGGIKTKKLLFGGYALDIDLDEIAEEILKETSKDKGGTNKL